MINHLKKIINFICYIFKFILSPPFCLYCRSYLYDYTVLCQECSNLIKPILSIKLKDPDIDIYAISDYKDPIKPLILAKTYSDRTASISLAYLIWRYTILSKLEFDYLVPVPLHFIRESIRGYNQAEVIAKELAFLSGKTMLKCIKRVKKTKLQSRLSGIERQDNVKNVFQALDLKNIDIEGKTFVLVDDLITTGATLKNCAKALSKFKPKKIYGIVGCRVCS